jgi:hypothetical protein
MRRHHRLPLAASFLFILTACGGGADAPESSAPATGEGAPLSREELEASAAAMSPETAESLGIVDTTIGVQSPVAADSLRIVPLPSDSAPL